MTDTSTHPISDEDRRLAASWSPTAGRFTDWLRSLAQEDWDGAVGHRFVRQLAEGSMPPAIMARYLTQDYVFLDRFMALLGAAIHKGPGLANRLPLARFAGMVASEENTYFQRSFEALDIPQADRTAPRLAPAAIGFRDLMGEAATGALYADALAVLVVAEWCYHAWAAPIVDSAPRAPFWAYEWITLHANPDFASFVAWLRGELDREGPALAPDDRTRIVSLFRRAVRLERQFFDDAYAAA